MALNNFSETPFVCSSDLQGKFDFIIDKTSSEAIVSSLKTYGFTITKVTEPVTIVRLIPQK